MWGQFFWGLKVVKSQVTISLANHLASFHFIPSDLTKALPDTHVHLQVKWISVGVGVGDPWETDRTYYVLVLPLLLFLTPKEAFCTYAVGGRLFDLKNEKYGFLIFLFQQSSDTLHSCH